MISVSKTAMKDEKAATIVGCAGCDGDLPSTASQYKKTKDGHQRFCSECRKMGVQSILNSIKGIK